MLEFMESLLTTTQLGLLALSLALAYVIMTCMSHPKDMPPMPCWRLPIFGHMFFMKPSLHEKLFQWKNTTGNMFTTYFRSSPAVILNTQELVHEAFVKMGDVFSDRPKDFREILFPDIHKGIIFNSGHSWQEQRSVCMSILKDFGMGKNSLAEKIAEEVEAYVEVLRTFEAEPRDPNALTNTAISNVMCSMILGQRFDYDDSEFTHFIQVNDDFLKINHGSSLLNIFPFLRYLPGDLFQAKKFTDVMKELNTCFSDPYIQKFKKELDDTSSDNYIKAYLREMRKREEAGEDTTLDESNLRRHIDDLFLAGYETSSTTILWSMVHAMNYPDVQRKIHEELDEVIGRERTPTLQDKAKLPYLNAFISETQRITSIAPIAAFHLCNQTTQLGGYRIPKDAIVISNLYAILHDEKTWTDPESFRPERFLDKDNKLVLPKEFIPFNIGKRYCLGESLAKMELFLFLSAIFRRFEIHPEDPTSPPSLKPWSGWILLKAEPFKLTVKERDC